MLTRDRNEKSLGNQIDLLKMEPISSMSEIFNDRDAPKTSKSGQLCKFDPNTLSVGTADSENKLWSLSFTKFGLNQASKSDEGHALTYP
jgi:hypothetical protein